MISRRVIKLGGSLLMQTDWPVWFARWRAAEPPALDIVISGGGKFADLVRQHTVQHGLSDETAHQSCLDCMAILAKIAAELLSAPLVDSLAVIGQYREPALVVLDVRNFLAREELRHARPLPHDWSATSDSIAARVAEFLDAPLVLLKSAATPAPTWQQAADGGYVDSYFPQAISMLSSVVAVNLASFGSSGQEKGPHGS